MTCYRCEDPDQVAECRLQEIHGDFLAAQFDLCFQCLTEIWGEMHEYHLWMRRGRRDRRPDEAPWE